MSIELEERLEPQKQVEDGGPCQVEDGEGSQPDVAPTVPVGAGPTSAPEAAPAQPTAKDVRREKERARQALRFRMKRERNPPTKSKKDNMAGARVRRSEAAGIKTSLNLRLLKPGLKLPLGCEKKVYTLAELRAKGFSVVPWSGL